LKNAAPKTYSIAFSRSASSQTMIGDFPPNSSPTFFKLVFADASRTTLPIAVEPVNETLEILGWCVIAFPTTEPYPGTMLTTPAGNPASLNKEPMNKHVKGVISLGLKTTQFPAAKAGANFHVPINNGKFQGEIKPTTPNGSLLVYDKKLPLFYKVLPLTLSALPAKYLKHLIEVTISN